jgi:cytochrome d ubiquinol oxidase subunit I
MDIAPFLLSHIQFAANISFHILFPSITIGLAWIFLFFRLRFTYTQDKTWEYAYLFWVKIFAFTFVLGIMLFGRNRVSNRVHLFATCMVAIGTTISVFWILTLNSWIQTPTGFRMEEGVVFVDSWAAAIFNPSFPYRFAHMVTACLLTATFFVAGVSAWRMLKSVDDRQHLRF